MQSMLVMGIGSELFQIGDCAWTHGSNVFSEWSIGSPAGRKRRARVDLRDYFWTSLKAVAFAE